MPHSVPHMVQLRKFIVSEDTVFLLLQYAEGKITHAHTLEFYLLSFVFFTFSCLFPYLTLFFFLLSLTPFSALVPDRCLIEMSVCHRSLF